MASSVQNQPCYSYGPTPLLSGLVYMVVLTLAILNPLACLIHCSILDMRGQHEFAHVAQSGASKYFCDMSFETAASQLSNTEPGIQLPTPAPTSMPRAVYEAVLLNVLLIMPLWLLLRFLNQTASRYADLFSPPLTPPPRCI